jgi:hypothetical protein
VTGKRWSTCRRDAVPDLETLRLQAEEWRIDAALHLGGHAELVPGLSRRPGPL